VYLIKEELVNIHDALLSVSGGDHGIYGGAIDLCVESPQREVYGYEPHKTLLEKAAALMYNVNTLHPFVCLLYTSPSPRDVEESRMPSSA